MNIHVIISTFNSSAWIIKCVNSLLKSEIPVKIKVIDNVSTDDTVAVIRKYYPELDLTVNKKNIGFGRANNILLRKAIEDNVDYVFLINADAWIEPNTIAGLVNVHQENPQYGILSPVHLTGSGKAYDHKFALYASENFCPGFNSDAYLKSFRSVYDINFVNGALWLISKDCLNLTGVFDPLFHVYFEDLDYINRLKQKGFKVGLAPAYVGYHDRENRAAPSTESHKRFLRPLYYTYLLKDNRYSLSNVLMRYIFVHNKKLFGFLFKMNFNAFFSELKTGLNVIRNFGGILKARKECRKVGAYNNLVENF
jgi:GT2 family glycosyltransferase